MIQILLTVFFGLFLIATGAGILGALLGIGGGVIIVPVLVLAGYNIQEAAAASIIAVIGTSTAAAAVYTRDQYTNLRLAMFLEIATTLGAITGSFLAFSLPKAFLMTILGIVLLYVSIQMYIFRPSPEKKSLTKKDPLSKYLRLEGSYQDPVTKEEINYSVKHVLPIFGISGIAGILSGMLGIGGGVIKVPALNLIGGINMRIAAATSNFMIGVTAATTAFLYFREGFVNLFLILPLTLGILLGASAGSKLSTRLRTTT
ncbi:MAG: sulfite exporter TauE/SafE family protein, partial [Candidatus Odinarchaeota archaeon]